MIEEELFRKNINLTYFLSNLCRKLLDKETKLSLNKKIEPLDNFRFLCQINENFKVKYFDNFSKFQKSLFAETIEKQTSNYDIFLKSAKEFIQESFKNNSELLREVEEETFGFKQIKCDESVCIDINSFLNKQINIEENLNKKQGLHFIYVIEKENSKEEEDISSDEENIKLRKKDKKTRCKQQKIRGITVEYKTHRIKNNKTKLHYNFQESDLKNHMEDFSLAILKHKVLDHHIGCKTFKIYMKNNQIKIKPGNNFKKRKGFKKRLSDAKF